MPESHSLTREGENLVRNWLTSQEHVRQQRSALNSAECDEANCHSALAKWLIPEDAKPGEKIAVWFGDSLIQVEVGGVPQGETHNGFAQALTSTKVTIRKRGKEFHRLASL